MLINKTPLYLLFQSSELLERALMPADELVDAGTPIDTDGNDMEYIGWATNFSDADNWVYDEIVSGI